MADSPDNPPESQEPPPQEAHAPEQQPPRPEQMAEESLESVQQAAEAIDRETSDKAATDPNQPAAVQLPDFQKHESNGDPAAALGMLNDIDLQVKVELGRTRMYIEDVLKLNANSIVELDKAAGDPVDIYVNDRHVARGEVLVLSDNFCVRVSEIIKQGEDEE